MSKPDIKVTVIKEEKGYSAHTKAGNNFIATEGQTFEELKVNMLEAVNFTFEEDNISYTADDLNYDYDYDLQDALMEGLESGPSDATVDSISAKVIKAHRAKKST